MAALGVISQIGPRSLPDPDWKTEDRPTHLLGPGALGHGWVEHFLPSVKALGFRPPRKREGCGTGIRSYDSIEDYSYRERI